MRRRSARSKSEEPKSAENLFAVGSTDLVPGPNCDDHMQDDVSTLICLATEKNDKAAGNRRFVGTYSCSTMFVFTFFL